MEQRLNFITLGVRNLSEMRSFYMNVFGWKPMQDEEGIVFFRLNGLVLALYPSDELADDVGIHEDGDGFKRFSISINFNSEKEVDSVYTDLVSRGARRMKAPEKVFWGGYRGYIADPENNYWELAYNPYLPLDSLGNVAPAE